MKSFYFFVCIFFLSQNVSSQLHISTNLRMDFTWDEVKDDWNFESQDEESMTFFEFNEELTLVKHVTSTMTSAYLIKSYMHDEEDGRDQYVYKIMSDVGNKYMMIVDLKNQNLRFVSDDLSYMVKHRIKASWTDD